MTEYGEKSITRKKMLQKKSCFFIKNNLPKDYYCEKIITPNEKKELSTVFISPCFLFKHYSCYFERAITIFFFSIMVCNMWKPVWVKKNK